MRMLGALGWRVWGSAALVALSCVGFIAFKPHGSHIEFGAFLLSISGLLAGTVVLSGVLIRGIIKRCGFSERTATKISRHFIGFGLTTSGVFIIAIAAMFLALTTLDIDGVSEFSSLQMTVSSIGEAVFTVFNWPSRSWALCSVFYGVTIYLSIIVLRWFIIRMCRERTGEPSAPPNGAPPRLAIWMSPRGRHRRAESFGTLTIMSPETDKWIRGWRIAGRLFLFCMLLGLFTIPIRILGALGEEYPWLRIVAVAFTLVLGPFAVFISASAAEVCSDLTRSDAAEPSAPPNGGPATQLGDSRVTEGPPSVS